MSTARQLATAALVFTFTAAMVVAQESSVILIGPSGQQRVTAAELSALPRVQVTIDDHGKPATLEGVELRHLLEKVGAPFGDRLRGPEVARYVTVEATDGYVAVFALAELDAGFTDRKVILADRREGKPLSGDAGPFQVIVEGEKRMGRSVRQVARLVVHTARR